tara:strand:+ start:2210 stop:2986 length:777 start_codon:yes stop_codon:yes gene_type:complete
MSGYHKCIGTPERICSKCFKVLIYEDDINEHKLTCKYKSRKLGQFMIEREYILKDEVKKYKKYIYLKEKESEKYCNSIIIPYNLYVTIKLLYPRFPYEDNEQYNKILTEIAVEKGIQEGDIIRTDFNGNNVGVIGLYDGEKIKLLDYKEEYGMIPKDFIVDFRKYVPEYWSRELGTNINLIWYNIKENKNKIREKYFEIEDNGYILKIETYIPKNRLIEYYEIVKLEIIEKEGNIYNKLNNFFNNKFFHVFITFQVSC